MQKGESSSLRTQLIEAQILDSQLEGDEYGLDALLGADSSAESSEFNTNANECTIRDIDDTIIRLRKWQLARLISHEESEVNKLEARHADDTSDPELNEKIESDEREEETTKLRHVHDAQVDRTKASLATIGCLLNQKTAHSGVQQLVDLSRLVHQDQKIISELEWNKETVEQMERDIYDSDYRRIIDEARNSSYQASKEKQNEIISSDFEFESDVLSVMDQFQYFSSALDSLLLLDPCDENSDNNGSDSNYDNGNVDNDHNNDSNVDNESMHNNNEYYSKNYTDDKNDVTGNNDIHIEHTGHISDTYTSYWKPDIPSTIGNVHSYGDNNIAHELICDEKGALELSEALPAPPEHR